MAATKKFKLNWRSFRKGYRLLGTQLVILPYPEGWKITTAVRNPKGKVVIGKPLSGTHKTVTAAKRRVASMVRHFPFWIQG